MKTRELYLELTIRFWQEGTSWVALCEELDVSSFGKTLDEARAMIAEAITVHLNTLEEAGERDRVFRERGITLKRVPRPARNAATPLRVGVGEVVERIRLDLAALA